MEQLLGDQGPRRRRGNHPRAGAHRLDRVTAESRHCCGERPRHEGRTLKFPFNTKKTTYPFWDPTGVRAFPAAFVAEERIQGIKVYRFERHFSDIRLQMVNVSGTQVGRPNQIIVPATIVYNNDKTLWVEPRTGRIIKAGQNVTQILQTDDGRPVLTAIRVQLVYDDATVCRKRQGGQLRRQQAPHDPDDPAGGRVGPGRRADGARRRAAGAPDLAPAGARRSTTQPADAR